MFFLFFHRADYNSVFCGSHLVLDRARLPYVVPRARHFCDPLKNYFVTNNLYACAYYISYVVDACGYFMLYRCKKMNYQYLQYTATYETSMY